MISWGMIGTGAVTEVKSGPAFSKAQNSRLYAVCNRTHSKALDYAKRHSIPVVHETVEALLADSEIDAVYVATPPVTHKALALEVIAAGKPLCLEKPMAMNAAECEEIINAASNKKVPVYVTYYRRSQEKFLKIKELLQSGCIGKIGSVQVTQYQAVPDEVKQGNIPWRFNKDIAGGGILVDMGSHVFDLLDFLLGPIDCIKGFVGNYGGYYQVEDLSVASFTFADNIVGAAAFNFNADKWMDKVEICGERGRLVFSVFDNEALVIYSEDEVQVLNFAPPEPVYLPFVEDMVKLLQQGDTKGYAKSATRTNRILDQLLSASTPA